MFEGCEHVSIRSLPGMAERTLRIGSAGKTFSLTAWKVHARVERLHLRPTAQHICGALFSLTLHMHVVLVSISGHSSAMHPVPFRHLPWRH